MGRRLHGPTVHVADHTGGTVHTPASRRAPWRRTLALLGAVALVFAACGGDDDDDAEDPAPGEGTTTTAPTAEPVRGGTLVYAVEADTASPWDPRGMICAAACHSTVGRTVFEPLVILGDDGQPHPYLLESFEANDDFTVWTLVVREGIKFHDGTDLNADAVAAHIEAGRSSALLAAAVRPIQTVESDAAMTVTVTMSEPWPAFPVYLNSQIGYVPSPTWTAAVDAGTADVTAPVGTGPFRFTEYESGDNGHFSAERFEDYWRGDGPNSVTGEGLPYLDGIEVRFIPDGQARSEALLSGEIDMLQTANGVEITDLEAEEGVNVTLLDNPFEVETGYILVNQSETDASGNTNFLSDERVRRALAHATNNEVISETRTAGRHPVANGPFPPGVIGHLDETGYPEFDLEAAQALIEEVEAELGPVTIAFKTTNDPFNLTTAELIKEMWEEAGVEVTIDQIPQGEFINQALAGNFQAFTWRLHAGTDPDQQFVWWHSSLTEGLALNFGRIIDPEVDRLLGEIRTLTEPDERQAAAEELNRYFAERVFHLWNTWIFWGLAHQDNVFNVGGLTIPGAEGVRAINMGANLPGIIQPGEIFETGE
jgi:peptide/nickel transport system substrate-binding protein